MTTTKFEIGQSYGNDLTMEVISRTEKTLTIKTSFGTQKIKIRESNGSEYVWFKCWIVYATESFDFEVAREISYYNAYCK
jgi:hypothetical protein